MTDENININSTNKQQWQGNKIKARTMSRLATLEKICEKKNTLTNPSEVPSMSSATRGICPRRMSSAPRLFRFFVRVFGKNYRSYEVLEYLGHL